MALVCGWLFPFFPWLGFDPFPGGRKRLIHRSSHPLHLTRQLGIAYACISSASKPLPAASSRRRDDEEGAAEAAAAAIVATSGAYGAC